MKTIVCSLSILILFFSLTSAAASINASCMTTIKCGNGTATCSAQPEKSGGTSLETGSCGAVSGNYRSCRWTGLMDSNNALKNERFICCNANGDAISLYEKKSAVETCASPGTVQ
ncbi:hypothetical protein [Bdellovibrio sp. HCB337]|uniref:hypothetical protein n=1 Tax=Bdellovibrio sp. HCB337 TaxID=3394358 RepID=UPI0039A4E9EF